MRNTPPTTSRREFLTNLIKGAAIPIALNFIKPKSVVAQAPEITNPIDIAQTEEPPVATFSTVSRPSVEGQQDPFSAGAILDYIDNQGVSSIFLQVDTLPSEFADLSVRSLSLALSGSLLMSLDQYYPEINSPDLDTSRRLVIVLLDGNNNIVYAANIYPYKTPLDETVTRIEESPISVRQIRDSTTPFPFRGINYSSADEAAGRGVNYIETSLDR
jgi:hypothetical protein